MTSNRYNKAKNKVAKLHKNLEYLHNHNTRFYQTLTWIENYLHESMKVLEIAGAGIFTDILKELHPKLNIINTTTDLRYDLPFKDNDFDFIINTEVLEHINDKNTNDIATTAQMTFNGRDTFLRECYRVLKPKHNMFLSTPNANSLNVLGKVLEMDSPFNYYYHVREYTPKEVKNLLKENHFRVTKLQTVDSWGIHGKTPKDKLIAILKSGNYPTEHRGDNIFVIARKQ